MIIREAEFFRVPLFTFDKLLKGLAMWFSASLFFESVHNDNPAPDDIWEEEIVLIQANTEDDAKSKAEEWGKNKCEEYVSVAGDRVRWVFRRISSIAKLFDDEPRHGSEVFYRFLRATEVKSLLTPFQD